VSNGTPKKRLFFLIIVLEVAPGKRTPLRHFSHEYNLEGMRGGTPRPWPLDCWFKLL
jgi:hypothetical protein